MCLRLVEVERLWQRDVDVGLLPVHRRRRGPFTGLRPIDAIRRPEQIRQLLQGQRPGVEAPRRLTQAQRLHQRHADLRFRRRQLNRAGLLGKRRYRYEET